MSNGSSGIPAHPSFTPSGADAVPTYAAGSDRTATAARRSRRFDKPIVGKLIFFATISLFCLVAAFAGYRSNSTSGDCNPVQADAAARRRYTIDVTPLAIRIGDQVCVRVAAPSIAAVTTGVSDPQIGYDGHGRHWHLLLNGLEVAETIGAEATPGRSSGLSFALPAPSSASSGSTELIAALWTGGLSYGSPGSRPVALRLHADALGRVPGYDLLRRRPASLHVFDPTIAAGGLVLLSVFAVGMVWLARNTGLLRDNAGVSSPTSLARTQMAFWFALTIAGFCYVWLLTGMWQDVVTPTTLVLLGISSTTGIGATAIASPKSSATSAGFLLDILSEQTSEGKPAGVVIHRLVMATWTVVLGGVFANTVLWKQHFPTFDPVLLVLIGISSGVYIGFKWLGS